ncbi:hypothetical protein OH76DRAFT_676640 [Lentinus brumalis]|uniref:Uncharacterized protein n=1 Tax=Lentinus brumalis TaxID=2498619 RepID=A0A371D6I7_9APHY|nr:hypothetical protein OH76DRAFT_676640 [Polyporus brumalis]
MNAAAAPAESEDGEDIDMDVDSGGVEEVLEMGGSDSAQGGADQTAGQPQTPQRSRPAQGHYPTPPNTTSPLARYHSRVSVNGVDLHDSHVGSFVPGVMDPGSSGSLSHTGANTGLPGGSNADCVRPEVQGCVDSVSLESCS